MQRGPAVAGGVGIERRAHSAIGGGQVVQTLRERLVVQHRAADQQRHTPARLDFADEPQRIRAKLGGGIRFGGIDDVDQMMRRHRAFVGGRLGGADIHLAIHERRIDADDFHRPPRGERERGGGLAGCGRAEQARDNRAMPDARDRSRASLPAHEQPIEIAERQLIPRRTAVIALVGALGGFHLAQQRVHFVERQAPVRAHRVMAGERAEQFVLALGQHARAADTPADPRGPRARAIADRRPSAARARRGSRSRSATAPRDRSRVRRASSRSSSTDADFDRIGRHRSRESAAAARRSRDRRARS